MLLNGTECDGEHATYKAAASSASAERRRTGCVRESDRDHERKAEGNASKGDFGVVALPV